MSSFKRLCSLVMAFIMIFAVSIQISDVSFAASANVQSARKEVRSTVDVLVGTEDKAIFTCNAGDAESVNLVDDNGRNIARMNDNGLDGDKLAGDGIFSGSAALFCNQRKVTAFQAVADGQTVQKYEVNYYNELTDADMAVYRSINSDIKEIKSAMADSSYAERLDAVNDFLLSSSDIEAVYRDNDYSIGYTTSAGINAVYVEWDENTKGAGVASTSLTCMTADGTYTLESDMLAESGNKEAGPTIAWKNPNILVVRPYRNYAGETGFHNDNYLNVANKISNITGGYTTILDNEDTNPYNLRENFYKNGFILVDSHGIDFASKSYICTMDGIGYSSADMNASRIILIDDDTVGVTGTFFTTYYEPVNRTLDNTFIYFGICLGMKYPSLNEPLRALGAQTVVGYSESVSFGYEGQMVQALITRMTTNNSSNNGYSYNAAASVAYAKQTIGQIDTYNGIAVMILAGNDNFVTFTPDVGITGITFSSGSIESFLNYSDYILPRVMPESAYGYNQTWTSSNPAVVQIVGPRLIKCNGLGSATITCTINDNVNGQNVQYSASCTINVTYKHVESLTMSMSGTGRFNIGTQRQINVKVFPENASNKNVTFISNNPGSATIDEDGLVTANMPGKVNILCVAEDGGISSNYPFQVNDSNAYIMDETPDMNSSYVITAGSSISAIMAREDNGYIKVRELQEENGTISGNINNAILWTLVPASSSNCFYIKSVDTGEYISSGSADTAVLTNAPDNCYNLNDKKLYSPDCTSFDTPYLRLRSNKGINFGRYDIATNMTFYKCYQFSDEEKYCKVTFVDFDGETIATQLVAKGGKAVPALPAERDGYTFLGWDKSMSNITSNITVNAMYRQGTTNKCVVTFMDFDATVISTVEVNPGANVTPPTAPVHEGMAFLFWSESLNNVTQSMTVFAVYNTGGIPGDANGDGSLTTGDATIVLRYSVDLITLEPDKLLLADINHDGNVNTGDAVSILIQVVNS